MYKIILLLLAGIFLSSCGGKQTTSNKFVRDIDNEILRKYKLPHGNLIAAYDLAKLDAKKNKQIFSSDYVLAINNEKHNSLFLNKFNKRYKNQKTLWDEAMVKVMRIKDLMIKLNDKYRFFNPAEIGFIKTRPTNVGNNLKELVKLDKIISTIPIMLPLHKAHVSSHYGMRKHPLKKKKKFHCGTDLVALKSSPVYTSASGVIIKAAHEKKYGNMVIIKHSHRFTTRYAHLKSIVVSEGDRVLRGEMIGIQGRTGNVTGEHLHFEIWFKDKHVDPFDFIAHNKL